MSDSQRTPKPLRVIERTRITTSKEIHLGWVRATEILLRGQERLRMRETALVDGEQADQPGHAGEPSA